MIAQNEHHAQTAPESPWSEPLLLTISHLTRYTYEGPVQDSFNEARLQPVSDPLQDCREFRFRITPDSQIRDYPDLYSNCVHYFDVPTPMNRLRSRRSPLSRRSRNHEASSLKPDLIP